MFETASGDPPYLSSRAHGVESPYDLVFFLDGSWTELPAATAVTLATALKTAQDFAEGETVPAGVQWSED
jgi:hypothetical protein